MTVRRGVLILSEERTSSRPWFMVIAKNGGKIQGVKVTPQLLP